MAGQRCLKLEDISMETPSGVYSHTRAVLETSAAWDFWSTQKAFRCMFPIVSNISI